MLPIRKRRVIEARKLFVAYLYKKVMNKSSIHVCALLNKKMEKIRNEKSSS